MNTLYVSDLDGTLLNDDARLSGVSVRLLNECLDAGLAFTAATARSPYSALPRLAPLRLRLPFAAYNGTFLIDLATGGRVMSVMFTKAERDAVRELSRSYNLSPFVYSFIDGRERKSWQAGRLNHGMQTFTNAVVNDKRLREAPDEDALYAGDMFYFTLVGEKSALLPYYTAISRDPRFNTILYKDHYGGGYLCETMPIAAGKANAVKELMARYGFDRLVCFGDQQNDLCLFDIADEAYAVANAHPDVKAAATAVLPANTDDGVAKWLRGRLAP